MLDRPRLSAEEEEALGTHDYISRVYQDVTAEPNQPGSQVQLHVAYYTGTPDTVPHVPDRCYVAGGARGATTSGQLKLTGHQYRQEAEGYSAKNVMLDERVHIPQTEFDATVFSFTFADRPGVHHNVVYFFAANGKFLRSPDSVSASGLRSQRSL